MNETLLYTLDPVIISILFKAQDDEATLKVYNELMEGVQMLFSETVKEYLKENGFSDDDIEIVLNAQDFEKLDIRFQPYIQNIILLNRIAKNTHDFVKSYYDLLIPNLTAEEKTELESYLKDVEAVEKEKKDQVIESMSFLKSVLEKYNVSNFEELKEKFNKAEAEGKPLEPLIQEPEKDSAINPQGGLNLGGVISGNKTPTMNEIPNAMPIETTPLTLDTKPSENVVENTSSVETPAALTPKIETSTVQQEVQPAVQPEIQPVMAAPVALETPATVAVPVAAPEASVITPEAQVAQEKPVETSSEDQGLPAATPEVASTENNTAAPESFDWASLIMDQIQNQNPPAGGAPADTIPAETAATQAPNPSPVDVPATAQTVPSEQATVAPTSSPTNDLPPLLENLPVVEQAAQPIPVPIVSTQATTNEQPVSLASKIDALGIDLNTQMPGVPQ